MGWDDEARGQLCDTFNAMLCMRLAVGGDTLVMVHHIVKNYHSLPGEQVWQWAILLAYLHE